MPGQWHSRRSTKLAAATGTGESAIVNADKCSKNESALKGSVLTHPAVNGGHEATQLQSICR